LKNLSNVRNTTNKVTTRIRHFRTKFAKEYVQISINKLRDRHQIISQFLHKCDVFQGEVVVYLDDVDTKNFTLLVIPKVTYSLYERGVGLENHFLSPAMCLEQPKSINYLFSKPPSITYIE
jgi:hypothetical protein